MQYECCSRLTQFRGSQNISGKGLWVLVRRMASELLCVLASRLLAYLFEVAAVICLRLLLLFVLDCKFMLTVAILSLLGRPMLFGKSYPRELSDGARLTSDGSPRGHQQTSYEQQWPRMGLGDWGWTLSVKPRKISKFPKILTQWTSLRVESSEPSKCISRNRLCSNNGLCLPSSFALVDVWLTLFWLAAAPTHPLQIFNGHFIVM